jgi:Cu(I)/Ag(I) efflux system membrane fusion protein
MKLSRSTLAGTVLGVVLGAVLTAALLPYLSPAPTAETLTKERKPDYWVAPMDANYRRDKPGKSPMGMDLIPVYSDENAATGGPSRSDKGQISIAPEMINNLSVRTATAEWGALQSSINSVGYVKYDEDRMVHIHPRVEGWVDKLYTKAAGDPVKKGDPLYALYSPQLVNAQEEFLLAVRSDNKRLIQASANRLKVFHIDDAFITALRKTQQVQQTVKFYAPQSGVIDNLPIREGFYVKPDTTMMSIATLEDVWVEVEIFERQVSLIETGLPVAITMDYQPNEIWHGVIDYIYPTLDPQTRTLRVRVRVANKDAALKPNMFAQVAIETKPRPRALLVPRDAVIRTGSQNRVVLALGDGRFKSVAVDLGNSNALYSEIKGGLEPDDQVVVSAQFLLDSESSKTSNFARMSSDEADHRGMDHGAMNHGAMNHGAMNHEAMNHEAMNHETMNHETMNHETMNHETMNHGEMNHGEINDEAMDHSKMNHSKMNHSE